MALRNRQQQQEQGQASNQNRNQGLTQQQTAAATALPNTIQAQVGGESVTLIAFGDIPGHSPSYLCVDDSGASNWVSMGDVQIVDARVLPLTPDLMARIQSQLQNIAR